eukprot:566867-Rhodomonas_salina.2
MPFCAPPARNVSSLILDCCRRARSTVATKIQDRLVDLFSCSLRQSHVRQGCGLVKQGVKESLHRPAVRFFKSSLQAQSVSWKASV